MSTPFSRAHFSNRIVFSRIVIILIAFSNFFCRSKLMKCLLFAVVMSVVLGNVEMSRNFEPFRTEKSVRRSSLLTLQSNS